MNSGTTRCYICRGQFGLKRYKRTMNNEDRDVCSKACQDKVLTTWGGNKKRGCSK